MNNYERKALLYAEKYGIFNYEVKENIMHYKESFPTEGNFEVQVDLDLMVESRRLVK